MTYELWLRLSYDIDKSLLADSLNEDYDNWHAVGSLPFCIKFNYSNNSYMNVVVCASSAGIETQTKTKNAS